jgi:hypothetical protein
LYADPFNGPIDEFRIAHVQRSDGWIATTWNNMSNPGAFAVAAAEEQEGGEPPRLAGAGVVVWPMALSQPLRDFTSVCSVNCPAGLHQGGARQYRRVGRDRAAHPA